MAKGILKTFMALTLSMFLTTALVAEDAPTTGTHTTEHGEHTAEHKEVAKTTEHKCSDCDGKKCDKCDDKKTTNGKCSSGKSDGKCSSGKCGGGK